MAAPLKKPAVPAAAPRRLLNVGAAPQRKIRLMGSNGQPIVPKLRTQKVAPAPGQSAVKTSAPEETPTPVEQNMSVAAEEEARRAAEEEARRAAEEEARRAAEEEARRAAEEEARRAAEEEARRAAEEEARRAAEEEARRAAQEAALTQPAKTAPAHPALRVKHVATGTVPGLTVAMPKSNQPAAKPAAAKPLAAAKPVAAAKPAVAGVAKPFAAKPSGATKLAAKPAAARPAVARGGEPAAGALPEQATGEASQDDYDHVGAEQQAALLHNVDAAYVESLRNAVARKPIWKRKMFVVICAVLVVFIGVCTTIVIQHNAEQDAKRARNEKIMAVLRRAREINRLEINTLADARAKKVDVKCSKQEARFLMNVVVNPKMKDTNGKPLFGNHPEGVSQLACMLLSIAAEADPEVAKLVFDRLSRDAAKIDPSLYRWLVQRLAVADIKNVNEKLHKLADLVVQKSPEKFKKRDEILSCIWETIGLRVTEKDIPTIVGLLGNPDLSNLLVNTLAHCLDNIIEQLDTIEQKKNLGDQIFDKLPENKRSDLMVTLAKSCSPKALAFYKQRATDPANWRQDAKFFSSYGQDDIIPYLQETLLPLAGDDARKKKTVQNMINAAVCQNRDRKPEMASKLIKLVYDKIDEDTSAWSDVVGQTSPDTDTFIGSDNPRYAALMEQRKTLEKAREQKLQLIKMLSGMYDWPWVVQYLERFSKENDSVLAAEAKRALEHTRKNRAVNEESRSHYKQRTR